MLTPFKFRKIYRASAWYDLTATAIFATPWTFLLLIDGIIWLAETTGLPGKMIEPDIFHIFFANLLGSVVIIWSLVRLKLDLTILARYDAVARFLFSAWMIYALLNGASYFILLMLVPEIIWGILQSLPVKDK